MPSWLIHVGQFLSCLATSTKHNISTANVEHTTGENIQVYTKQIDTEPIEPTFCNVKQYNVRLIYAICYA